MDSMPVPPGPPPCAAWGALENAGLRLGAPEDHPEICLLRADSAIFTDNRGRTVQGPKCYNSWLFRGEADMGFVAFAMPAMAPLVRLAFQSSMLTIIHPWSIMAVIAFCHRDSVFYAWFVCCNCYLTLFALSCAGMNIADPLMIGCSFGSSLVLLLIMNHPSQMEDGALGMAADNGRLSKSAEAGVQQQPLKVRQSLCLPVVISLLFTYPYTMS